MNLTLKDLETIERIIYKNGDDIAISAARRFEQIADILDDFERRITRQISELKDKIK